MEFLAEEFLISAQAFDFYEGPHSGSFPWTKPGTEAAFQRLLGGIAYLEKKIFLTK